MIQFGRYENLEEVGRGGFATVYKALDAKLNRTIALKVLHAGYSSDPSFVDRFHQEAQTVAKFNHPGIVTIYDYGEEDRQLYIAMEYLSGGDLQAWLNRNDKPLTMDEALPFLKTIANALDYAHKQGMVHRDIKPSNMMLQQTGNDTRIVLTDFGLVKAMEGSMALTMTNQMLGSPEYMSPEQADITRADEIGPATDLYAFGIVAYQMLAGRVPFPGHTLSVLNAHINIPPPYPQELNDDLSPEVAEILLKMLAKAPADRYPTATAFVNALETSAQTANQNQQREAQVAPLYEKLLVANESHNWLEVMTLAAQIEFLIPNYKDVDKLKTNALQMLDEQQVTGKSSSTYSSLFPKGTEEGKGINDHPQFVTPRSKKTDSFSEKIISQQYREPIDNVKNPDSRKFNYKPLLFHLLFGFGLISFNKRLLRGWLYPLSCFYFLFVGGVCMGRVLAFGNFCSTDFSVYSFFALIGIYCIGFGDVFAGVYLQYVGKELTLWNK